MKTTSLWVGLVTVAVVAFVRVAGDAPASEDGMLPRATLTPVSGPVLIDGRLAEPFWAQCAALALVRFPGGETPYHGTTARVATDGTWLLVSYECEDPTLLEKDNPVPWTDTPVTAEDAVELFIDPGTGGKLYFHFAADRFGRQHDKRCPYNEWTRNYQKHTDWNAHWRAAGATTETGWSVEMAIPLHYLLEEAGTAEAWRINFCRHEQDRQRNLREWSQWSRTLKTFHDPARFGVLEGIPHDKPAPVFLPVLMGVRTGTWSDAEGLNEYPVLAALHNHASVSGEVTVLIDDNAPGGKRKHVRQETRLAARDRKVLNVQMQNPGMVGEVTPDPVVTVSLEDSLGAWRASMNQFMGSMGRARQIMDLYLDRNYYTGEDAATLYYDMDLPAPQLATLSVKLAVRPAKEDDKETSEALLEQTVSPVQAGEQGVRIPLQDLPFGSYALDIQLVSAQASLMEQQTLHLVRRRPLGESEGNEVKVDRYHRCLLLNGKPFFPYGVAWLRGDMATLAGNNFNMFIRWGRSYEMPHQMTKLGKTPEQIFEEDETLQGCLEHGLYVVDRPVKSFSGLRGYKQMRHARSRTKAAPVRGMSGWFDMLEKAIPVFKSHPALLGYMNFDEPHDDFVGDTPRAELSQNFAAALNHLDGYHPVFNNANIPKEPRWRDHVDFISTYQYWNTVPQHLFNISGIQRMHESYARKFHMPRMNMPNSGEHMGRLYLPSERRVDAYVRLVHGARGLYFFTWPAFHKISHESFRELGAEIRVLAPALCRRRPPQRVRTRDRSGPEYFTEAALLATPDRHVWLMLLSKSRQALDLTVTLPWAPENAQLRELFIPEKRHGLADHTFTERLEGYAVRVYELEGYVLPQEIEKPLDIVLAEATDAEPGSRGVVVQLDGGDPDMWRVPERWQDKVSFDPETAHMGSGSLKITTDTPPDKTLIRVSSKPFALKAGHAYRLEGWIRTVFNDVNTSLRHRGAVLQVYMLRPEGNPYIAGGVKDTQREWTRIHRERRFTVQHDTQAFIRLQLWRANGSAWFDDIRLVDLGPVARGKPRQAGPTKNRVPNSGFEQVRLPGWPDRWRPHDNCDFSKGLIGSETAPWGQDFEHVFEGNSSLRMEGQTTYLTMSWYQRMNAGIPLENDTDYVFSAYIKASRKGVPLRIALRDFGSKIVNLSTDWQRYVIKAHFKETAHNNSTTAIIFRLPDRGKEGDVVWIDALQLEQGMEPTTYERDAYNPPPGPEK